ncbi:argininosuccinate lyase [Cognatiyoonia sp. IB215446]|uniref:argininosuccinate lyase n=1 Tax=Cognatiyoonia sp. IB215446 TaxID=3097355 RepID=UPI002A1632ED|nr:argininosuccinate lyase [Cognatiyoonia sp. IB215446]MDX8348909.1 argininosuccinate lyase [Cognatiyoonia sp. IB215446]
MTDKSVFPDPVYRDTVLAPLFEGVKANYAAGMASINRAHLVMLAETGILPPTDAAKLAKTLAAIEADVDIEALTYTGEHEDYFFLVEAELRARLGDLGGSLHTARSRNDMDHTLFKLALRQRVAALIDELHALADALIQKARKEADTLIVAYTHGQPAQPTTFGHYLGAIIEVILRDAQRLDAEANGLEHCPMGAAAITTSGFPIDRQRVADLLGFEEPLLNSYGCIASVDYVTGLYSSIKLIFIHLGRLIQDLQFWSAFEVGQIYVPNSLVQISSIMPQKRNPVPIEHLRHMASVTVGRCDMVVGTMHNTPFTDMNDSEGEVQQAGYAAFESGSRVLRLLTKFLPACRINAERVSRTTDAACITITELADTLVRDEGLSFRQAHEIAATVAKAVIKEEVPLGSVSGYSAFQAAFADATGRTPTMDEAAFKATVAANTFVARRDRPGGPAKAALLPALDGYAATLADLVARQNARKTRHATAEKKLNAAFADVMGT